MTHLYRYEAGPVLFLAIEGKHIGRVYGSAILAVLLGGFEPAEEHEEPDGTLIITLVKPNPRYDATPEELR